MKILNSLTLQCIESSCPIVNARKCVGTNSNCELPDWKWPLVINFSEVMWTPLTESNMIFTRVITLSTNPLVVFCDWPTLSLAGMQVDWHISRRITSFKRMELLVPGLKITALDFSTLFSMQRPIIISSKPVLTLKRLNHIEKLSHIKCKILTPENEILQWEKWQIDQVQI